MLFATRIVLSKIYSVHNNNPVQEQPWIDVESRKVLEALDPKLVHVLDQLFERPDYMSYPIKQRIERRLYLFPFMTHDERYRTSVYRIVDSVMNTMFPVPVSDTLKPDWARNRYSSMTYEIK